MAKRLCGNMTVQLLHVLSYAFRMGTLIVWLSYVLQQGRGYARPMCIYIYMCVCIC